MLRLPLRRLFSTGPNVAYRFPDSHAFTVTEDNVEMFAKRVIKCIRERLLSYDPERWQGVEISYKTHWNLPDGYTDIDTCIQIHEALEKEFKIEIIDSRTLLTSVQQACSLLAGDDHLV